MTPRDRRNDARLTTSLTLASVSGGLFLPLSLVFFTILTDIQLPMLGAIMSASVAVGLPLPFATGVLVDRWGARRIVPCSLGIQSLAYVSFVGASRPIEVFLACSAMAIGVRLFWSSVFSYLADHADAGQGLSIDAWFGRLNAARTVGIVAGSLITAAVVSLQVHTAYLAVAWAAAACTAGAACLLLTVSRTGEVRANERTQTSTPYTVILRDGVFGRFLALNSVLALATLFLGLSLPTVIRSTFEGPGWLTAAFLVINALAVALGARRGAARAELRSRVTTLRLAALLWAGAFAVISLGVTLTLIAAVAVILLGVTLLSAAEVLHAPASASLVDKLARGGRGRYLAVSQYSFVIAELVGPILFTALYSVTAALPFAVLALACAVTAWMLSLSAALRLRTE